MKTAPTEPSIDVIYVQPESTGTDACIDFRTFASYVSRFDDPVSTLFSKHLLAWRQRAGSLSPSPRANATSALLPPICSPTRSA